MNTSILGVQVTIIQLYNHSVWPTSNQHCIVKSFIVLISRYITHTSNWLVHASVRSSFEYTSGVYRCIMHTHNHEYVLHLQYNKCSAVAPCSDTLGSQPGCIHVHNDEDTINQDDDSTGCIDHDITLWCHYLFHYLFICTIHSIIITFFLSQWSIKLLRLMTLPCFSYVGVYHLQHAT